MEINIGDVIQINSGHEWEGCLAIVSDVNNFNVQAYVIIPLKGKAYIRLMYADFVKIGKSILIK